MEFHIRRAWAWIATVLFINSWHLVTESDKFQSFNQMLWEVNITVAFQGAVLAAYFLFIKFYWKRYYGLDLARGDIVGDDRLRLLYDVLSRRRRAK